MCSFHDFKVLAGKAIIYYVFVETMTKQYICYKIVKTNQRAIQCDCCESWAHIKCNDISPTVREHLKYKSDLWHRLVCSIKTNLDSTPFTVCNNLELTNINNSDSMRFLESLPNVDIVEQIVSFTEHASNDSNIEIPAKGTCKYYSVKEYQLLNEKSNFNIFHSNINGLESKLDNLHEFLTVSSTKLDLLAITVLKKKIMGFLTMLKLKVMKNIIHPRNHQREVLSNLC